MPEFPTLYTPECIVFGSGLEKLNEQQLATPITVYEDIAGHHSVAHGNHRAYYFYRNGLETPQREIIGKLNKDVSKDPYYHPISELIVR